jgi:hypothetical protein
MNQSHGTRKVAWIYKKFQSIFAMKTKMSNVSQVPLEYEYTILQIILRRVCV